MAGDAYLHTWDERFHANVAKHIWAHPLSPTLYDRPVLPYDHRQWAANHIWLSKPALPFWIMGASIELFGPTELGLRLPGLLLSLLSVWLTYLIGRRLFSRRVALFAAFLHAIHGLTIESAGGLISSDHVDTVFTTVCFAVVYFTLRQVQQPRAWISYLIGALLGAAFLSKWIMAALLGPIVLSTYVLAPQPLSRLHRDAWPIVAVFLLVALPWPIYLFRTHPEEALHVARQLIHPVGDAIHGHTGGPFYYLDQIRQVFGELIYLPLGWLLYRVFRNRSPALRFLAIWLLPILLLSFAGTKRATYLLPFAPAFFLLTAFFGEYLWKIKHCLPRALVYGVLLLLLVLPVRYSIERLKPLRPRFERPAWRTEAEAWLRQLDAPPDRILLIGEPHAFEWMYFYGILAYDYLPPEVELERARALGYRVYERGRGEMD